MKNFWMHVVKSCAMLAIVLSLTCCSNLDNSKATTKNPTLGMVISNPHPVKALSSTIDTIAMQVLTNMHQNAWNPNAMTKGVVTGGLYINWKMSDPTITNVTNAGPDGNPQHDHDPQVDLFYLTALAQYQLIHPQDHSFDADLNRATTLILADFQNYSQPKGWIYFYLLQDSTMLHNSALLDEAHALASNLYTHWYDPALGFVYDRNHTPGVYNPNNTLSAGAALIDAGTRWHQSAWLGAGKKTINHTIANALNPQYHLFYNSLFVSKSGQDQVQDSKAEAGPQGQIVDALMTAYTLTHQQQYLTVATGIVQSLFGSSGLWDKNLGGLFFALDMHSGIVTTQYKETRGQSLVLLGLQHYDQVERNQFAQQELQLLDTLTNHFYQTTYHGYFYRLTADFQIYVTHPGQGNGVEYYFTTEAMGDALNALQQSELTPS